MTDRCPATLAVAANRTVAWLEYWIDEGGFGPTGTPELLPDMQEVADALRKGLGTAKEKSDE